MDAILDRIWHKEGVKRVWESKRIENRKKDGRDNDSEVIKGLSKEISSHMNPLEPKGVHPLVEKENQNGERTDKL